MTDLITYLITLTCPTCGTKFRLIDDVQLLVCTRCGNKHLVHRGGEATYMAPIAQDVRILHAGIDKTSANMAVTRLTHEVAILNDWLEDVAVHYDYEWAECPTSIIVLALTGIALILSLPSIAWGLFNGGDVLSPVLMGAIGVVCLAASIKIKSTRLSKIKHLSGAAIERINDGLAKKSAQLVKYRRHNHFPSNSQQTAVCSGVTATAGGSMCEHGSMARGQRG